jgi:hypothetical protein
MNIVFRYSVLLVAAQAQGLPLLCQEDTRNRRLVHPVTANAFHGGGPSLHLPGILSMKGMVGRHMAVSNVVVTNGAKL